MLEPEKREFRRLSVDLSAKCRVIDGAAHYDVMHIVDMTHQGCCIEGYVSYQKNDVLRIIIELPFEGQITLTAQVIWSGPVNDEDFRTGTRFLIDSPLAEEMRLKLYHFCLLRQPKD